MRFEHVLKIYWTKGFFYGGHLLNFNTNLDSIIKDCPGLGKKTFIFWSKLFEMTHYNKIYRYKKFTTFRLRYNYKMNHQLNLALSQLNSINFRNDELQRLNIVRLYLIKSYRGRCHALGKPVKAQRTWSNAWSSYYNNKILRSFITETRKQIQKDYKPEKINYKIVKKKYGQQKKKNPLAAKEIKESRWF